MAESRDAHASWIAHARQTLADRGHRSSAAREDVIAAVAELGCSVTVREIADRLRERGSSVGLASIYRALDLLESLGVVQRFAIGESSSRYEPAHPSGDHHHHIVCDSCGTIEPFADAELERVISRLSRRADFAVDAHDVTLHGECPGCRARSL